MTVIRTVLFVVCVGVSMVAGTAAQEPPAIWPGARYDAAIPTLKQISGHEPGEEITTPDQVGAYVQALAKAAPRRARLSEYARTWEGRPLWLMVIGSPERIARLEHVQRELQRLADPRTLSSGDADRLVQSLPVVTWLSHGVHGNEISSSDAALFAAYHLLASQGDADVETVLRESLVLIDPMQNPDGRARFIAQNLQARAAAPDPTPYNAEHDEPWPGGRSNHYLFDLNRDWFAQTQPETRGRITVARQFVPQIAVDLHEQGGDNTYYFAPPADPLNPHVTKSQAAAFDLFGRANAARFDERGWPYFIREVYDAFYPGYGDSWPTFQGAIGMTYEQASARGLSFARSDKTVMTYRDGVMHHANAAIVTAITGAKNRERLLRDFLEYRRSAIAEGEKATAREYVLLPASDPSRSEALARNLATQGIDVRRADEAFKIGSRDVAAGPYLVSAAQPTSRLIRNLLEPKIDHPADFPKRQEERRARRQADQIYDITAWSLPLLYDVELVASPAVLTVKVDALQQGLRVRSIGGAFTLNGRRFPIGTALFRTAENPTDLATRLSAIASRHGGELIPIDSSFVESGTSLGSSDNAFLKPPRVLLVWDTPTAALSAGWTRFVLERRFGQPVTAVRAASLARAVFADFDVIILPSGNYAGVIGDAVVNRLKDWLRGGGTLITMAEATRWATTSTVGLLDTTPLLKDGKPDVPPSGPATGAARAAAGNASAAGPAFDYDKAIQPDRERPASQPGAILRVTIDTEHWLSAGSDEETQAMIEGQRVFAPIKLNSGRNVGVYAKKDRLIASGLVWPETQDLLVQKAFLMHQPAGQGHVVAFAEEPNYRGFSEASMLLFMNAVLLGPGY